MGDKLSDFRPQFNGSLRIEARQERLTAQSGAAILREVDERLGVTEWLCRRLDDGRNQAHVTHPLRELVLTAVLLLAQGWRDEDDADVLRDDAVLRMAVSTRRGLSPLETRSAQEREANHNPEDPDGLASQPTLSRLCADLSSEDNRSVLRRGLLRSARQRQRAMNRGHRRRYATIDVDSIPVDVEGHQPGSQYNGYYHRRIYHPLIASLGETGDILDARLRKGKAHTAEGGLEFIEPLIDEVEREICQVAAVRFDAGFPEDELLLALEARGTPYVARIKNNEVLNRMAAEYLRRPPGRPPAEPRTWFHEMTYKAGPWSYERRVVLVVMEREGELFLHRFWLVTDWTAEEMPAEALLEFYRQRGTAEGHFGELLDVLAPALSSSPRPKGCYDGKPVKRRYPSVDAFAVNEVRLLLNALAYNLMNTARLLLKQATREGWSLRRLRERVLRAPARLLLHARYATLVIGEAVAALWHALWSRLVRLKPVPG